MRAKSVGRGVALKVTHWLMTLLILVVGLILIAALWQFLFMWGLLGLLVTPFIAGFGLFIVCFLWVTSRAIWHRLFNGRLLPQEVDGAAGSATGHPAPAAVEGITSEFKEYLATSESSATDEVTRKFKEFLTRVNEVYSTEQHQQDFELNADDQNATSDKPAAEPADAAKNNEITRQFKEFLARVNEVYSTENDQHTLDEPRSFRAPVRLDGHPLQIELDKYVARTPDLYLAEGEWWFSPLPGEPPQRDGFANAIQRRMNELFYRFGAD